MNNDDVNTIIMNTGEYDLEKYNDKAQLVIKGDVIVNAINLHNNMQLKIVLEDSSSLVFNIFDLAISLNTKIDIEAQSNANFTINGAFIAEQKYELEIETKLYGDNILGTVNVRGINEREGVTRIVMNGTVAGETHGCVLNEYARIINKSNATNVIIPNLIVNTNQVEANHGASLGQISFDEVFYLMSKGISQSTAIKLIEEGFILLNMSEKNKNKIQNILLGR